jgi:hypothetical protein
VNSKNENAKSENKVGVSHCKLTEKFLLPEAVFGMY